MITEAIDDIEYLSVKDFAERAGITTQYVYKLADNKLQPYITVTNDVKLVSSAALSLFPKSKVSQQNNQPEPEFAQQLPTDAQPVNSELTAALQETIVIMRLQQETLVAQLAVKDKQISDLSDMNRNSQVLMLNTQKYLPAPAPDLDPEQPIPEPAPSDPKRHWWQHK